MMPCLPKDLLNLVFLELENGHTMINFSEISRKCNQIFNQNIKITTYRTQKFMKNIQGQKHGISRVWYQNGQLRYENNYLHNDKHGIQRAWYKNGQLAYKQNWFRGARHGICRTWTSNGQLNNEDSRNEIKNFSNNSKMMLLLILIAIMFILLLFIKLAPPAEDDSEKSKEVMAECLNDYCRVVSA